MTDKDTTPENLGEALGLMDHQSIDEVVQQLKRDIVEQSEDPNLDYDKLNLRKIEVTFTDENERKEMTASIKDGAFEEGDEE